MPQPCRAERPAGSKSGKRFPLARDLLRNLPMAKPRSVYLALFLFSWFPGISRAQLPAQLSLDEALALVADHPGLRQSLGLEAASLGRLRQNRVRPNPTFTLQSENWRFRGFDASQELEVAAFFSQPLEIGGKRANRLKISEQGREIATLMTARVHWDLRQRVKVAFLRMLLAQKSLQLLQETGRTLDELVAYHETRVREGIQAEVDLIKIQVDRQRLELEVDQSSAALDSLRQQLVAALGIPPVQSASFELLEYDRPLAPGPSLTRVALISEALKSRLELRLARAELSSARARTALEQSPAKPDPTLIFGYKRADGYNAVLGGLQFTLPWFDRNRGNIEARVGETEAAEGRLEEITRLVQAEVLEALTALQARAIALGRIRRGLLQRAEETLRISLDAYQEQALDLLRLLDARNTVNSLRTLLAETEIQYEIDKVRLETAVGRENLRLSPEVLELNP